MAPCSSPWTMHSGGTKTFVHQGVGGETMVDDLEQRSTVTNGDSIGYRHCSLGTDRILRRVQHGGEEHPNLGVLARLLRFARAMAPTRIVPIHSSAPHRFGEFFDAVELHDDGQWWEC